jgi:two-component system response regulator AtoC
MAEIAIVDDEKVLVNSMKIELRRQGYRVHPFYSAEPFLDYIRSNEPDTVFLDLQLPDINGIEVLRTIMQTSPYIPTIIITAHGDMESAIQAMKMGAFDYINKPFDLDEISILIKKALHEIKLLKEVEHHRERVIKTARIENIIGKSPPFTELLDMVKRLSAAVDTTVLLLGESGTGKDLIAKVIHNLSDRALQPLIDISCASFPENLIESELFGYEKGAFTDAKHRKTGLLELADKGTLYLDEIGELPLTAQAKLLRFIEDKSFRRIGGKSEIRVDVRIIAATNRNLEEAVKVGMFREDLFYRLNVVPLVVPPLRERGMDIIAIARHYLEIYSRKFGRQIHLRDEAKNAILDYDWPGNVRELKNLCERLAILSRDNVIGYEDLPSELKERITDHQSIRKKCRQRDLGLNEILEKFEEELIDDALKKSGGIKSDAAERLGISRYALLRKMKRIYG